MNTLSHLLITPPLWLALVVAAAFAGIALAMRWLTRAGALATLVVGFIVVGLGGGKFLVPLLTFFLTSTLLSRMGRARKAGMAALTAKGPTRDAGQVWANGGVACAVVLLFAYVVHRWPVYETRDLLMLYLAAIAAVNADTWATEIGGLARQSPRLLTNWKPAAPGTSGAITGLGLLAAVAGAIAIPLSAYRLWNLNSVEFVVVAWAGFLGSLVDSVLGASVQAQFRDTTTDELTERVPPKGRGVCVRGLSWINNDVVNLLASASGVLFAWILLRYGAAPFR